MTLRRVLSRRWRRLLIVMRRQGWVGSHASLASRVEPRRLNLALQGGGAHGAFTWGALDRLLEERRLAFSAISGTSAGAINAVLLASGLIEDGPAGALGKLARFWTGLCRQGGGDATGGLFEVLPGLQRLQHAGFELIGKFLAPAQFNPLDVNPMREQLRDLVDFERLRREGPDLFIAATDAATGRKRIFTRADLSLEAVMASACLPQIHHAVEIDGLGRRLCRQSAAHAADQPGQGGGHAADPDHPAGRGARAGGPRRHQRGPQPHHLQRAAAPGDRRDRADGEPQGGAIPAPPLPFDRRDAGDRRAAAWCRTGA